MYLDIVERDAPQVGKDRAQHRPRSSSVQS
jgi:hypothetical protein